MNSTNVSGTGKIPANYLIVIHSIHFILLGAVSCWLARETVAFVGLLRMGKLAYFGAWFLASLIFGTLASLVLRNRIVDRRRGPFLGASISIVLAVAFIGHLFARDLLNSLSVEIVDIRWCCEEREFAIQAGGHPSVVSALRRGSLVAMVSVEGTFLKSEDEWERFSFTSSAIPSSSGVHGSIPPAPTARGYISLAVPWSPGRQEYLGVRPDLVAVSLRDGDGERVGVPSKTSFPGRGSLVQIDGTFKFVNDK
ncbi:MAG: hypothetical protein O7H41_02730 [Planctomycetota bacterium]|nr:hypothetical protein [Planctomycetota bacterium]